MVTCTSCFLLTVLQCYITEFIDVIISLLAHYLSVKCIITFSWLHSCATDIFLDYGEGE